MRTGPLTRHMLMLACLLCLGLPGALLADGDVERMLPPQDPPLWREAVPDTPAPFSEHGEGTQARQGDENSTPPPLAPQLDSSSTAQGPVPQADQVPGAATAGNATSAPYTGTGNAQGRAQDGVLNAPSISWASYFKALGGLFLILGLVFGGLYLLKRVAPRAGFGGPRGRQLQLESTLSLGPRKSVAVVRFLNKQLVLGVTDTHITCLHIQEEDHAPEDDAYQAATPNRPDDAFKHFADRLKDQH
ncbi:MAG: flagellar biosynthetic protein FliO [Desulfovibrio sp.]|nr:flagellar biosynthetic protein FliO [Desulfovibrio sp.]MCA1985532.1 flagellar biosynthetic protein FliO [Desulfovibrio sp.]